MKLFFAEQTEKEIIQVLTSDLNFFSLFILEFSEDMPFFYGLFSIMFAILLLGVGLWVVYGVLKDDLAIIVTNGFSLVLNMSMLYLMLRYSGKK